MDQSTNSKSVLHDIPPYVKVYTDGTVERLVGTDTAPPGLDPQTGVVSKDVAILPETGVSVRIYHPDPNSPTKLPLVVYFHGGAFLIASTAEPKYHNILNILAKHARVVVVSVDYRLAPENPLLTCYDDSFAALQWVASHLKGNCSGNEPWLRESVDFDRLFLAGDSAGANICHHMAMRNLGFKISGIVMVHPYFWGEEAIGVESENLVFKSVVDGWWRFVCPSDKGCDDPLINPFVKDAPHRGLTTGKWKGKAEFHETSGEDHVFHIFDPVSCLSHS